MFAIRRADFPVFSNAEFRANWLFGHVPSVSDRLDEKQLQEYVDDGWVPLTAALTPQDVDRLLVRQGRPIRTIGDQGIIRVHDTDDARLGRNVVASKTPVGPRLTSSVSAWLALLKRIAEATKPGAPMRPEHHGPLHRRRCQPGQHRCVIRPRVRRRAIVVAFPESPATGKSKDLRYT